MSIFGKIASAIFGKANAAETVVAQGTTSGTASPGAAKSDAQPAAKVQPMTREQVETMIQKLADSSGHKDYNWRQSIVDLMKLLGLDSSLAERKELAKELGYSGALDGSAAMNVWLHQQVVSKLMESGGKVPDSMKD